MSDKKDELAALIKQNPNHELIFMYPDEVSDHTYTMAHIKKIVVTKYWDDLNGNIWLEEDFELAVEHYRESIFDDLSPYEHNISDEQLVTADRKTEKFINNQDWKECICVYIHP